LTDGHSGDAAAGKGRIDCVRDISIRIAVDHGHAASLARGGHEQLCDHAEPRCFDLAKDEEDEERREDRQFDNRRA
jgi:hypothetical protein